MQDQEIFSRAFKGIWIPKEIWLDKRLTYFERCLLAEIHSLDDPIKGCFASNQYFMEFFNERERKIQEGISKLKELGYVFQEKFDGRVRVLKTNLNAANSFFSTSEVRQSPPKNDDKTLFSTSEMLKSAPLPRGNPHPSPIGEFIEPDNKGYNKDKKEEHPPNPPEGGGVRVACGAFVKLSKEEKQKLEEAYGSRMVDQIIEEMNDYIAAKGKKPYKDYAAAIRTWARSRGITKSEKPKEDPMPGFDPSKVEERMYTKEDLDEKWFLELQSVHPVSKINGKEKFTISGYLMSEGRIWMHGNHVEFLDLPEGKFYYGRPEFRHQVDSALRKLNITVKT